MEAPLDDTGGVCGLAGPPVRQYTVEIPPMSSIGGATTPTMDLVTAEVVSVDHAGSLTFWNYAGTSGYPGPPQMSLIMAYAAGTWRKVY